MKFQVELQDLRQALTAVLPHAGKPEDLDRLGRVRFWLDPINMTVGATNTVSLGIAIVSVLHEDDSAVTFPGEDGQYPWFDLRPDEVKKILAVHKTRKVAGEDVEQTVMFDVHDDSVATQDISGLFAGNESLAVPLADTEESFPHLPAYVGSHVRRANSIDTTYRAEPLGLSGPALAAFVTSGRAYGFAPVLRLSQVSDGKFVGLVTVGESFIGLVTARDIREQIVDADQDAMQAWEHWENRLPDRYEVTAADSAGPEGEE